MLTILVGILVGLIVLGLIHEALPAIAVGIGLFLGAVVGVLWLWMSYDQAEMRVYQDLRISQVATICGVPDEEIDTPTAGTPISPLLLSSKTNVEIHDLARGHNRYVIGYAQSVGTERFCNGVKDSAYASRAYSDFSGVRSGTNPKYVELYKINPDGRYWVVITAQDGTKKLELIGDYAERKDAYAAAAYWYLTAADGINNAGEIYDDMVGSAAHTTCTKKGFTGASWDPQTGLPKCK